MTRDEIAAILGDAVGNPSVGAVAEVIPAMADALDKALNPKADKAK